MSESRSGHLIPALNANRFDVVALGQSSGPTGARRRRSLRSLTSAPLIDLFIDINTVQYPPDRGCALLHRLDDRHRVQTPQSKPRDIKWTP